MGWCSGAGLADKLWQLVRKQLNGPNRIAIAREWVHIFESEDCDCMLETNVGRDAGIKCTEELGSHWGDWYNK